MSLPLPVTELVSRILPRVLPKSSPIVRKAGSLYQMLSAMPKDGVGMKMAQDRWVKKGITDSYWEITQVRLKDEGRHGKAWGKLVWKGIVQVIFVSLPRLNALPRQSYKRDSHSYPSGP